jgi:hypothetical protein
MGERGVSTTLPPSQFCNTSVSFFFEKFFKSVKSLVAFMDLFKSIFQYYQFLLFSVAIA